MKVFYITGFPGHYPVGTAAVIVASDRSHAFRLLHAELKKNHSLELSIKDVNPTDFKQLDVNSYGARVLCDGNY